MNAILFWKVSGFFTNEIRPEEQGGVKKMDGQSFYFQTIARKFFELRGAPFFLSSNELSLIEKWEAAGIPLRVVLEGIRSSFSARRQKHGGTGSRRRIRSLSFCETHVKEAFTLYKERAVGRTPTLVVKTDKKKKIHTAVAQFLDCVPQQVVWLEAPFKHVKEILLDCMEEDLERAEENIEALMVANASPDDQQEAKKEAAAAFPDLVEKEDFQRIFLVTLIKLMRGKYKIPHVAPFLY
jgi:hypothetical protein